MTALGSVPKITHAELLESVSNRDLYRSVLGSSLASILDLTDSLGRPAVVDEIARVTGTLHASTSVLRSLPLLPDSVRDRRVIDFTLDEDDE